MKLNGKIAVMTGASGGIGSALAKRLDAEGVNLVLIDKDRLLLNQVARTLKDNTKTLLTDLTEGVQLLNSVSAIFEEFTQIDFLFNIAGVGIYKPIKNLEYKDWKDSIDINLNAPFYLISSLMPLFPSKESNPLIFNVGSGMGVKAIGGRTAYCASKFGLRGLSLALSEELKNKIDVSLLTLGSVMNDFGTGGIEHRKTLQFRGKKYLSVEQVVDKIMEIVKSDNRKAEYTFYPNGY